MKKITFAILIIFSLAMFFALYINEKTKSKGIETYGVVRTMDTTSSNLRNRIICMDYFDTSKVKVTEICFAISSLELNYNAGDTVKIKYLPSWPSEAIVIEEKK